MSSMKLCSCLKTEGPCQDIVPIAITEAGLSMIGVTANTGVTHKRVRSRTHIKILPLNNNR
jgi:hypothetical protein